MKISLTSVAFAAFAFAGTASASTVNVQYQASGVFGPGNLQQSVRIHSPVYNGKPRVGLYHLTGDNGVGDFVAFCVDLAQYLHNPTTYTIKPDLFGGTVLTNIKKLFNSALGGGELAQVIDTSVEAAGLQVALWEVITETGPTFDVASGDFWVSENAAAAAKAQSYLDGMAGAATDGYDMTFYYSSTKQDVVTVSPVPVPAAGMLLLTGLGGIAALRRRKKS